MDPFVNSTVSVMELPSIETPMEYELITQEQFVTITEFLSSSSVFLALCGVILNSLNMKTFVIMGLKDGVSITFLTLAISDFCFSCVTTIQSGSRLGISLESKYDLWFSTDPWAVDVLSNSCALCINTISTMTTAFLAIARCMCVAKPLKFKNMFTIRRSLFAFAVFCAIAMGMYTPLLMNMGIQRGFDNKRNQSRNVIWLSKNREKIKDITLSFTYIHLSVITQTIIVVCVIVMVTKLRQSVRFRQGEVTDANHKEPIKLTGKERTVAMQVVCISLICISCNFVKVIHSLFNFFDPKYGVAKPRHYFYVTMGSVRVLFDAISATVNFFVYIIFNSRFRLLLLKCKAS